MRINHNIAAMNTYGKLTANNSATAKSLEKLSSGLKINRAGDNAAGLAISEKMRAQIRGLDQASTNASDAISLIQTAEGSLSETHSILQRMKELATQAANDTNTTSDRSEIQKEINQLSSEINRIGNTTEFNTRLLLNGGTEVDNKATASGATLFGGLSVGNTNAAVGTGGATVLGTAQEAAVWDSGAFTALTDGQTGTLVFNNTTVTINGADNAATGGDDTTIGVATGTAVTITLDTAGATTAAQQLTHVMTALNAMKTAGGASGALASFTFAADTAATGLKITDTLANGDTNNALAITTTGNVAIGTAGAAQLTSGDGNQGVDGVRASGNITFSGVAAEGTSLTIANKKVSFFNSSSGNFADAAAAKAALSADYVVDTNGITTAAGMASAVVAAINSEPISGWTVATHTGTPAQIDITATSTGVTALTSAQLADRTDIAAAVAASGSVTFSGVPTEDSKVTIGSKSVGFYDSESGKYADAAAAKAALGTDFVIDAKDLTTADSVKNAVMAYGPQITDVVMSDGGVGKITVTAATAGAAGNQIKLTVPEKTTSGFDAKFQIGANSNQSMQIDMSDMRSQALDITNNTGSVSVTASNGKVAYYTSTSNVTNGTDNTNTEFALDVSTHEKATAAISVLSDAIQTVSAERSKMGAYQNRLEHTINNLGTSSENLSAAESRIRDVDMAKEMMEFQKNNILSQAATSMLAQANQQPQGVLQLLQ